MRYGNQKPEQYLGAVNIFEASEENTIYYQRFNYYLIGYIISGVTFLVCIGYLIYEWKKEFFKKILWKVRKFISSNFDSKIVWKK